jgi:hypothetical protein
MENIGLLELFESPSRAIVELRPGQRQSGEDILKNRDVDLPVFPGAVITRLTREEIYEDAF